VLKLAFPNRELRTEAATLRLADGRAYARLVAEDLDAGALLIERLSPGQSLHRLALTHDPLATALAADVIGRVTMRVPPGAHPFLRIADWIDGMHSRARTTTGVGPRMRRWLSLAHERYASVAASRHEDRLLHGDLHHGNILACARSPGGWRAIDPKGIVGDVIWETGPLLFNALPSRSRESAARSVVLNRVDQLAEALALPAEAVRDAGIVRCVLSAFWSIEGGARGRLHTLEVAQHLLNGR
jgi:streptomycin 6-kinase